jgi:4'-phosphopantetheinyl transferase
LRRDFAMVRNATRPESLLLCDPGRLSLPENTVHVWVLNDAHIEHACAALAHTLSADELQRACAYKREKDRVRFIARRSILRSLIGRYLDCRGESLRFRVAPFGKLALQQPDGARLAFNVSQTDGTALLAFAWDCHVGVDVERLVSGMDVIGIGREVFSSIEEAALDAARPDSATAFFTTWSRKESLLKALGTGLSGEPKSYTTGNDSQLGVGRWTASHKGAALTGWTCLDIDLRPEFHGSLAVSLDSARVSLNLFSLST